MQYIWHKAITLKMCGNGGHCRLNKWSLVVDLYDVVFFIPPYIYDEGLFYLSIHFILWKGTSTFRSRIFIFYCNAATNPSSPWPKVVSMIKYILLIMVDYIPNHLHIFITSTLQ